MKITFCDIWYDRLPNFSDSFFFNTSTRNDDEFNTTGSALSSTSETNTNIDFEEKIRCDKYNIFATVKEAKQNHPKKLLLA